MASDDEDYVGSGSKYDSLQLDPEDPKPSLLERKDAEKRTSSPSIKSDMPKPRFERGQTLYCYDGPDLYPAKCLKIEHDGKMYSYLIHYNGWSKTYDEWMCDDDPRLPITVGKNSPTHSLATRSKTPSPIKLEEPGIRKTEAKPSPLVLSSTSTSGTSSTSVNTTEKKSEKPEKKKEKTKVPKIESKRKMKQQQIKPKRANAPTDYQKRFVLHIVLPEVLKEALQDDYEFIAKQQKLMDMPVAKSVKDILEDFSKLTGESITDYEQYFNSALGSKLLYKFERPKLADFLRKFRDEGSDAQKYPEKAPKPSEIYGFPHLLRFVYHLDMVLCEIDTEFSECLKAIKTLQKIADYLQTLVPELHKPELYHETAPEYHRRAQS